MSRDRRGFTLIETLVVVAVLLVLTAFLIPAVQAARAASRRIRCENNLRQIGVGLNGYLTLMGVYPFGVGADSDGPVPTYSSAANRRYSAHSQFLMFIDQTPLFNNLNFDLAPFDPGETGDPRVVTGRGANETVALTSVDLFLCPSDYDRMPSRPWGQVNYRTCNGSTWTARAGDGMFGQSSRVRPGDVTDGLSNTVAFSERIRGHDDFQDVDLASDMFHQAGPWDDASFRAWCGGLSDADALALPRHVTSASLGMTWLEGNMSWTRYNHVLPPGGKTCSNGATWNGTALTASSRHGRLVNVLLGDGSTRPVRQGVDPEVWRALATIARGDSAPADAY